MKVSYKHALNTPILTSQSGRPLTSLKDFIVDPNNGKIVALVTDKAKNIVISPMDVLSWTAVILINSDEAIIEAKDILRVAELQKQGIGFINKKVESKSGDFLGKVADFEFSPKTFELFNIHCVKSILGLIKLQFRIIPIQHILEVTPEKIIVKDDLAPIKEKDTSDLKVEDLVVS